MHFHATRCVLQVTLKDQEPTPRLAVVSSSPSDTAAEEKKGKTMFYFIIPTFF